MIERSSFFYKEEGKEIRYGCGECKIQWSFFTKAGIFLMLL